MTATGNERDRLAIARLRNFFHHRTPWQRSLWSIGTVTGLHEVLEYCELGDESGLPNEGLRYSAGALRQQLDADFGIGEAAVRSALTLALEPFASTKPGARTYPHEGERDVLRHLAARIDSTYLDRWAAAWTSPARPSVEASSRLTASHLLDAGFSAAFLDEWIKLHFDQGSTFAEVLESAGALLQHPGRSWTVVVPVRSAPQRLLSHTQWLNPTDTALWFEQRGIKPITQAGCMIVAVTARDQWGAVRLAAQLLARIQARARLGLRLVGRVISLDIAYVDGFKEPFQLHEVRRRVEVPNLSHTDQIGLPAAQQEASPLDDAYELAASMHESSLGPAITGGWAAVEGLLLRPKEQGGHIAADRMAALITCSFPRAELDTLARRLGLTDSPISEILRNVPGPERPARLEEMIGAGTPMTFMYHSDEAALHRLKTMVSDPESLRRVQGYISSALRRLYNQRNMIMHTGRFQSCALGVTIRTTPPLVGAGLDRIAYGDRNGLKPLELVARAEVELSLLGEPGSRRLAELVS